MVRQAGARGTALRERRENVRLLPGVRIPDGVLVTASEAEAADGADLWVGAVPTQYLRATLGRFRGMVPPAAVSLTKGLELDTFKRPSEIIADVLGTSRVVVLSGPSHAEEVSRGYPTSVVAAGADAGLTADVQRLFGGERFRVYTNPDAVGVELAGALKNVLGIAAGVCDGLGYGDNAKAALLTRGLTEMARFGVAHGAEHATFQGMAGLGDLIATCFSRHGRNRRVGERSGRGEPLADVLAGPTVAEGVTTAKSVHERASGMGLEVPICSGVARLLYEGLAPADAVRKLMTRRTKRE